MEWEWCDNCQETTLHLHYYDGADKTFKEKCTKCGVVNQ